MKDSTPDQVHRILVIDDTPGIHADFRKILCAERGHSSELEAAEAALFGETAHLGGQARFEIKSAHQGLEGLAMVHHALQENRPFALAFVDVQMPPGLDGIEITPRLWKADPEMPIVICTAFSDYSWEEMFARTGATDRLFILQKPFDRMEVLQLAHTLSRRRAETGATKLEAELQKRNRALKEMTEKLQAEIAALKRSQRNPS